VNYEQSVGVLAKLFALVPKNETVLLVRAEAKPWDNPYEPVYLEYEIKSITSSGKRVWIKTYDCAKDEKGVPKLVLRSKTRCMS